MMILDKYDNIMRKFILYSGGVITTAGLTGLYLFFFGNSPEKYQSIVEIREPDLSLQNRMVITNKQMMLRLEMTNFTGSVWIYQTKQKEP